MKEYIYIEMRLSPLSLFFANLTAPLMERSDMMILFTILLITLLVLAIIVTFSIGIGGAAFIVVFGDVIVCMLVIVWIMKKILKRRK